MKRTPLLLACSLAALPSWAGAQSTAPAFTSVPVAIPCRDWDPEELRRNPTDQELRCRFGVEGPGRFGLLSYEDVPVYQPATPMPGTHLVGVKGHTGPAEGESYEEWEWRMLRTPFGAEAHRVHRALEMLDPFVAGRILDFEARLARAGIHASRRETWRAPERQAFLFQQGRSRPGPLATATLTSWHSQVDAQGRPAGRAVDYDVSAAQLPAFHRVAEQVGLHSFGADSNDPGHVFLPDREGVPAADIVMLRVLPRVPEVTLATGLPVDRSLPPGGRSLLRSEAAEFASLPYLPYPSAEIAAAAEGEPEVVIEAKLPEEVSSKALPGSAGGGARGERRGNGGS